MTFKTITPADYLRPSCSFQADLGFSGWLVSNWFAACGSLGPKCQWNAERALDEFHILESLYQQPHRHYHNLQHLAHCFSELEWLRIVEPHLQRYIKNLGVVRWAIWFHDAVYDSKENCNEELSSDIAVRVLRSKGCSPAFIYQVQHAIFATGQILQPVTKDAAIVVDIDQSILGRPKPEFDAYCNGIAKEYNWVQPGPYAVERIKFLKSLLSHRYIYRTAPFSVKYEATARKNIEVEIGRLEHES